jgi:hypothetical protein
VCDDNADHRPDDRPRKSVRSTQVRVGQSYSTSFASAFARDAPIGERKLGFFTFAFCKAGLLNRWPLSFRGLSKIGLAVAGDGARRFGMRRTGTGSEYSGGCGCVPERRALDGSKGNGVKESVGETALQSICASSTSYVPKFSCSCETKVRWWREPKKPRLRVPDSCASISFSTERGKNICVIC